MKRVQVISFAVLILFFTAIGCQKEFSTENGIPDIQAAGSLRDTFGECFTDSVHGTFYNGVVAGSDTAYVEIKVNVTSAGSYNIQSDLQNGLQFSDSGYFASTGINTVLLKPADVANTPASTVFSISFDSSVCSFIVDVKDSTGTGLGGGQDTTSPTTGDKAWGFSDTAGAYSGVIDTAISTIAGPFKLLTLDGDTDFGDSPFALSILFPGNQIKTGTYTTAAGSAFIFADNTTGTIIYQAGNTESFTIAVTDYSNNIITGTFAGNAVDSLGGVHVISSGTFSTPAQ